MQKSYTPDLPGDFSGGAVRLTSRSIPERLSGDFSIATGGNHRSTFADAFTHAGGDYDWAGFDDGDSGDSGVADGLTDGGQTPLSSLDDADRQAVART
ncbi:MAG: hypothetical protein U5R48_17715 [Gammaproteobacteria bacterium]|nr:hypothetical protein [Gammaproteobacteria bacterium]